MLNKIPPFRNLSLLWVLGFILCTLCSCTQKKLEPVDIPTVNPRIVGLSFLYDDLANSEKLRKLSTSKFDIEKKDQEGATLLIMAAKKGHLEAAKILLEKGADPNEPGDCRLCPLQGLVSPYQSRTPLHWAARSGDLEMVKLLVGHGGKVGLTDNEGNDAYLLARTIKVKRYLYSKYNQIEKNRIKLSNQLVDASKAGETEKIKELIDKGACVNCRNRVRHMPLKVALENHQYKAAQILLNHGADINFLHWGNTLLYKAVRFPSGHKTARFLINHGADPNIRNDDKKKTALHEAVEWGHVEIAKLLLDHGAGIDALDAYGETPITRAVERNQSELVALLLDRGADVNLFAGNGNTPYTCGFDPMDNTIEMILKNGPGINEKTNPMGYTYLHGAVAHRNRQYVERLLKQGADVNINYVKWNGKAPKYPKKILYRTPLHFAAEHYGDGKLGLIDQLLDHGAKIDAQDSWGMTPLHLAALNSDPAAVNKLIERGAAIDVKNYKGETPLFLAAWDGNTDSVYALLNAGANVNVHDLQGNSPLHRAIEKDHFLIVSTLLDSGADINEKNGAGKSPYRIALENQSVEVFSILYSRGITQ